MKKHPAKQLFKYLGKQKIKLSIVIFLAFLGTIISLLSPLVMSEMIKHIEQSLNVESTTIFNISYLVKHMIYLIIIYATAFILKYLEQYLMAGVSENICLDLRRELMIKLQTVPLSYYDANEKGEILSRATNDIERINESLRQGMIQFVTAILTIVGSLILMIFINTVLLGIALVSMVLVLFFTRIVSKKTYRYFNNYQTSLGHVNGYIEEVFTGQMVIKAFNQENIVNQKFENMNEALFKDSRKAEMAMYMVSPSVRIVNSISYVAIGFVGVFYLRLPLSTLQAFIQYTDRIADPIIESAYILNGIQQAFSASSRVFDILDQIDEVKDQATFDSKHHFEGHVVMKHVSFGYKPEKMMIEDFNLEVKKGQKIAIVGPTGAGKTTLVNLLMRFYEINQGTILIDGVDIKTISRAKLRSLFGMVLQDTWLFGGSIKDNIAYAKTDAQIEDIVEAAKSASAHHFIKTLPEGYHTKLNEDATNISQGQKQLLTIARVFLANPQMIILDEATSSVDTKTEIEIQKAMHKLMQDKTSFIIAHRLSTIKDADVILVMNQGKIIEKGTHEDLMAKAGFYYNLYHAQFEEVDL